MAISGSKVLTSLLNGQLASKIAEQASMRKYKEVEFSSIANTCHDPVRDDNDDASDEEMSMADARRRAKAVSQEAAAQGRLPKSTQRQVKRKSPFAAMTVLSDAFELLGKLTRQPSEQPAVLKKSLQRLEDARAPVEDVQAVKSSPQLGSKTAAMAPRSFRMDAAEDACFGDSAARESSLARGYDALDAQYCTIDDGSDTDCCGPSRRTSSITRGYDALGLNAGEAPSHLPPVRPPSRGAAKSSRKLPSAKALAPVNGDLAPVTSPCRGAAIDRKSLRGVPTAAPSAMDLDLENTTYSQQPPTTSKKQLFDSTKLQSSGRVGLSPTLALGKNANAALPPVQDVRGAGAFAFSTKSGSMVKTGSAALWDVRSVKSTTALHNRRAIF